MCAPERYLHTLYRTPPSESKPIPTYPAPSTPIIPTTANTRIQVESDKTNGPLALAAS